MNATATSQDEQESEARQERFAETDRRLKEELEKPKAQLDKEQQADRVAKSNATGADYLRQRGYSDEDIKKHDMLAKEKTARDFYHSCENREGRSYSDAKSNDHMNGIDFRGEVKVETVKKGELLAQQQEQAKDGKTEERLQGNYYAPVGTEKKQMGIVGERASGPEDPGGRKLDVYQTQRDVKVLKSTASDVELNPDPKKPDGELRYGGGSQVAARPQDRGAFERVVEPNRAKGPDNPGGAPTEAKSETHRESIAKGHQDAKQKPHSEEKPRAQDPKEKKEQEKQPQPEQKRQPEGEAKKRSESEKQKAEERRKQYEEAQKVKQEQERRREEERKRQEQKGQEAKRKQERQQKYDEAQKRKQEQERKEQEKKDRDRDKKKK